MTLITHLSRSVPDAARQVVSRSVPDRARQVSANSVVPLRQDDLHATPKGTPRIHVLHVFNRGVDRQDIFNERRDHEYFESRLQLMVGESDVRVHAYSLMTNHDHCLVEAEGEQLSRGMYVLGKSYAVGYNRSAGRTGPLCASRFKAVPITSSEMLMVEGRYVHRNPIDLVGVSGLAGYRYSSLPAYLGVRRPPAWLTSDTLLEAHGHDPEQYRAFVERSHPSDSQAVHRRPPLHPATLEDLENAIGEVLGVRASELLTSVRGVRNDARIALCTVAVALRAALTDVIASTYGFSTPSAVRAAASRGRALRHRDAAFDDLCRTLTGTATQLAAAA